MILKSTITLFALLALVFSTSAQENRIWEGEPKAEVLIFMAPKCNICKFYTKELREIASEYEKQGITFTGLFPNAHTTWEQIQDFRSEFKINFHLQFDEEDLADEYEAGVTPEVVVRDYSGKVLYSGRIDNSYVRVGKRRRNTSSSELRDALEAILAGEPVTIPKTTAIGCIIERPKK